MYFHVVVSDNAKSLHVTVLRGRSLGRPETTSVFLNLTSVSLNKQPSHPIATAPRENVNSTDLH